MSELDKILTIIAEEINEDKIRGYKNLLYLLENNKSEEIQEKLLNYIHDLFENNIIRENEQNKNNHEFQYSSFISHNEPLKPLYDRFFFSNSIHPLVTGHRTEVRYD